MTRNSITVLVVASLLLAPVSPASAGLGGAGGVLSGDVAEAAGVVSTAQPSWVQTYDAGKVGVYVSYKDGKHESLRTWANSSTDRTIQAHDNDSNRMLVSMPVDDLGASRLDRLLNNGLASKDYVTSVAFVQSHSAEPVDRLEGEDGIVEPTGAWAVRADYTTNGVAYAEDANKSTLAEAGAAVGTDNVSQSGDGVTVAVLDTGLNVANEPDPMFQNRTTAAYNAVSDEAGHDNVSTSTDHGPWVASAIAADPNTSVSGEAGEGVAPNATVMPVKVLSDDGSGSTESVIRGIEWADTHGADVVSLSLGSVRYDVTLANEIQEALDGNVTTVIVAAGNSRQQPGHLRYVQSPGDVDGVITVGATNVSDASTAGSAYFSSVGPDSGADLSNGETAGESPDIAAPGMNITATFMTESGGQTNATLSGTSMATPIVSGVAALTLDANPSLVNDTEAFRETLLDGAEPIPNAGTTEVGEGMIDAENAVSQTEVEESQEGTRNEEAENRDAFNEAYSGSRLVSFAVGVRGGVTT